MLSITGQLFLFVVTATLFVVVRVVVPVVIPVVVVVDLNLPFRQVVVLPLAEPRRVKASRNQITKVVVKEIGTIIPFLCIVVVANFDAVIDSVGIQSFRLVVWIGPNQIGQFNDTVAVVSIRFVPYNLGLLDVLQLAPLLLIALGQGTVDCLQLIDRVLRALERGQGLRQLFEQMVFRDD